MEVRGQLGSESLLSFSPVGPGSWEQNSSSAASALTKSSLQSPNLIFLKLVTLQVYRSSIMCSVINPG